MSEGEINDEPRDLTVREAGQKGGKRRLEQIGREGFADMGRKGGERTRDTHGPEFYAEMGKKGGAATVAKHGIGFYEKIGRKGGKRVRELIAAARAVEDAGC